MGSLNIYIYIYRKVHNTTKDSPPPSVSYSWWEITVSPLLLKKFDRGDLLAFNVLIFFKLLSLFYDKF